MKTITRFAPSPTGLLHLGGARTALYNYLYAKKNNGLFKLRIEDTDKDRSKIEFSKDIIDNLRWLGLNWDDEVIYQSNNKEYHRDLAEQLLKENKAYKCYSTKEEIDNARALAKKEKKTYKYDRKWRDFKGNLDKPFAIRVKIPLNQNTLLNDKILGKITINNNELEDFIILRSDKTPTYMLSVVADDKRMSITDVIRGDDHLTNTFKQLILIDLLSWSKPNFSHIPLIHSKEGGKLSKRYGDLSVKQYKNNNYLPESLINYLLRLGWGYHDKEFFTIEEAKKLFSLEGVRKSPAKFDEKKLSNLNSHYFKNLSIDVLFKIASNYYDLKSHGKKFIEELFTTFHNRSENINEFLENIKCVLINEEIEISDDAKETLKKADKKLLDEIFLSLNSINDWNKKNIETIIKNIAKNKKLKLFLVASPIRALITGKTYSPSIFKILELLGKEKSLKRIKKSF